MSRNFILSHSDPLLKRRHLPYLWSKSQKTCFSSTFNIFDDIQQIHSFPFIFPYFRHLWNHIFPYVPIFSTIFPGILPSLKHGCPPGRAEVKEILRANKTRHTMAATDVRGRSFCTSVYMECIPLYSYIVYKLYNDIRLYIYTQNYTCIYIYT